MKPSKASDYKRIVKSVKFSMVGFMDFKNFKPCLLIAMPELKDTIFEKSVVLLSDYEDGGAMGFVINQETGVTLDEALSFSEGDLLSGYKSYPLYFGGPVDPERIWIVYDQTAYPNVKGFALGKDVALAEEGQILIDQKVILSPSELRVFHGYAGWGAQQLEEEIASSVWLTTEVTRELVFETPVDQIWEKAIRNLGIDPAKLQGPSSNLLN